MQLGHLLLLHSLRVWWVGEFVLPALIGWSGLSEVWCRGVEG